MFERNSAAISPTAHYTGEVWARHGLSHPTLSTSTGRLLYQTLRPMNAASAAAGGPTLEQFLLARHKRIDECLSAAIDAGRVGQVIEVGAGLSPRGWRFTQKYSERLVYVEADLPEMAALKRQLLSKMGARHTVADLDAMADSGPHSLAQLAKGLDPERGTAIITEGLVNYFDTASVISMWRRIAQVLSDFHAGLYLSDLHLGGKHADASSKLFSLLLSTFVRGRVHFHFDDEPSLREQLHQAGFDQAAVHQPGNTVVRVIEAFTG